MYVKFTCYVIIRRKFGQVTRFRRSEESAHKKEIRPDRRVYTQPTLCERRVLPEHGALS